ncbi:MAG TPA: substrate-binding domain-containing protein [Bacteroidales bacterium]|nr:substrate-binding domain-containing protein [Bacteroidales bacterium]
MNRVLLLFLFILPIAFGSCKDSGKVKIGYLVPNLTGERFKKEQTLFQQKIQELGGEALVASADYSDKRQIQQANEMIAKGAKVLVVNSVNMNTAAAIVRDAHQKGVGVIAYDRLIQNSDVDYYITYDNAKVGKLMAESAIRLKPAGNYVLLGGDKADLNAVLVKKGQLEALEKYVSDQKIKIVFNIYVEDWSGENASHELKRFLDLSGIQPDVILSSYDGMSTACIKTLEEFNLDSIVVTGQDAELDACRNIVNNKQTMTVYKPLKTLVEKAAEVAYKMATGQKTEIPKTTTNNGYKDVLSIYLDPIAVDKNNIKTTIVSDGFYTEKQLFD